MDDHSTINISSDEDDTIATSVTSDDVSSSTQTTSSINKENKEPIKLSSEQARALDEARNGSSLFITGSAGVGKSFLLKEVLKDFPDDTTYVTASTGVAAIAIGGSTLHSFSGIGLGEKPVSMITNKMRSDVKARWKRCRTLIIDEISMIDGVIFEKVEEVARIVRKSERPFGGIQLIICGDFLQLPPVKSQYFAFETKAWSSVVQETIVLKEVFRQKDGAFVRLLNRLRIGKPIPLDIEVLHACRMTKFLDDGIKATRLFPKRFSCDNLNHEELEKLDGLSIEYECVDRAQTPQYREMLEKNSRYPSTLKLRHGAQVMLLKNKDPERQLVNGSRGVVVGFRDCEFTIQENLMVAYERAKKYGYLGKKGLEQLFSSFESPPCDKDESFGDNDEYEEILDEDRYPIVLFGDGEVDIVHQERQSITVGGNEVACRVQIPLQLAWAVSVHKSQGLTLDRIDVSLEDAFEHGQTYVALSRVRGLDGLLLRDFNQHRMTAHPKVLNYYENIDPECHKWCTEEEGTDELQKFIDAKKEEISIKTPVKYSNQNEGSVIPNDNSSNEKAGCSSTQSPLFAKKTRLKGWLSTEDPRESNTDEDKQVDSHSSNDNLTPLKNPLSEHQMCLRSREGTENIQLSEEQRQALQSARNGHSIFVTGSAGVGKSFLLKEIMKEIRGPSTYITASTGVAACNIGGITLHSFAGLGLAEKSPSVLANSLFSKWKKEVRDRWMRCQTLVVDEISMIDGAFFQKLEEVSRIVRGDPRPFGGIQIILCGDFLQLPPVNTQYFAFETKAWKATITETIVLKKVFRQKEVGFVKLLNRLRTGQPSALDIQVLSACRLTKFKDDGIEATKLFPKRYSCDNVNNRELQKLKGESKFFLARDTAKTKTFRDSLEKNSRLPSKLELRCGAQVMLLVNKDLARGLVNGSRGVVIGFRDYSKPLEEDLADAIENGKDDSYMGSMTQKDLLEQTVVRDDDEDYEDKVLAKAANEPQDEYPIVRFDDDIVDVIKRESQSTTVGTTVVATRTQIPLLLAWAVSIHKSQGMTIPRIDVNLAEAFEHGQSYVALSRVTSLDGLLLRDFNKSKIRAHPKVLKYYKKIDPSFDEYTQDGDDDLKTFVEMKKRSSTYANILKDIHQRNEGATTPSVSTLSPAQIKEIEKKRNAALEKRRQSIQQQKCQPTVAHTNILNNIQEQSECISNCSDGILGTSIPNSSNIKAATIEAVTSPMPSMAKDSASKFLNSSAKGNLSSSPSKTGTAIAYVDTPLASNESSNNQPINTTPDSSAPTSSKALKKAESFLERCRQALEEAQSSLKSDNDYIDTVLVEDSPEDKSSKGTQEELNDVDGSLFETDDFDKSLINEPVTSKPVSTIALTSSSLSSSSSTIAKPKPINTMTNFLDNICPDLLNAANNMKKPFCYPKRKRSDESSSSSNGSPLPKRTSESDESDRMKNLLKAKADEIERKRKAALEKRRQTVQQQQKHFSSSIRN